MGVNVFTASGRCGSDMEVKYTQSGKAIGSFSLPVETGYGDNKKTAWVSCKMFNERAEKLQQYIKKGSLVTVTGAFQLDEWEKDGIKHSRPVILVNDIQLPPNQQQGDGGGSGVSGGQRQPLPQQARQAPNQYQQARGGQQRQPQPAHDDYQGFDDSLPF